jgi:hypothetical protein
MMRNREQKEEEEGKEREDRQKRKKRRMATESTSLLPGICKALRPFQPQNEAAGGKVRVPSTASREIRKYGGFTEFYNPLADENFATKYSNNLLFYDKL